MSKDHLEPGDIVARIAPHDLGIVMRCDEESGFLVAYPGHDELIIERPDNVRFLATLGELLHRFNP